MNTLTRRSPKLSRCLSSAITFLGVAVAAAPPLSGQDIQPPDVAPVSRSMAGVGAKTPTGERMGVGPGSSGPRPAWVVGDVPDTVWMLVEASVAHHDEDRAKEILREAERLARASIAGHEGNVGRRFGLAAVLGMRTDVEGGRTKVRVASDLYRELGVVLELDPEHTRARYMMGRLHAGVRRMNGVTRWMATNLLGGGVLEEASWEEAEQHLAFAEHQAPEVPDHHLQLARLYLDTRRPERAADEVLHVLGMEARSPLELAARREALELADELELADDPQLQERPEGADRLEREDER